MKTEICNFKIEYMKNPIGVDTPFPHYSWEFKSSKTGIYQEAFRIVVKGFIDELFWDSGWVESDKTFSILHEGKPLKPDNIYKVYLYTQIGGEEIKHEADFSTGLLGETFRDALWIEAGKKGDSLIRKTFLAHKGIAFAHLYISARGFYEPFINGKRIGNRILSPAMLNDVTHHYEAVCDTYDITNYLSSDNNTIGIRLAAGYKQSDFNKDGWTYEGNEKLWCAISITYEDGDYQLIVSDDSWVWRKGAVINSSIYGGENYNKNSEIANWTSPYFDISTWRKCVISKNPEGILNICTVPVIRKKILKCLSFETKSTDSTICDFGYNGAGRVRIKVTGEPGTKVYITHSENIFEDGNINTYTNMSARATDTYTLKGHEIEIYEPEFTYHSFRYAQIRMDGAAQLISAEKIVIGAAVDDTGYFHCNDTILSRMFQNARNSIETNLLYYPANCGSNHERIPDFKNSAIYSEFAIHCFDMHKFYNLWLKNIKGYLPNSNPLCSGEIISLPSLLEEYYGDRKEKLAPFMMKAINKCVKEYKKTKFENASGDWCAPREDNLHNAYEKCAHLPIETELAELIHLISVALKYVKGKNEEKLKRLYKFFIDEYNLFLDSEKGYALGEQTANILALEYNIAKDKDTIYKALKERIKKEDNCHLKVGISAIRYLIRTLSKDEEGLSLLAKMLTAVDFPSFGQQILEYDATSLCQQWLGIEGKMTCHNPMFSGLFTDYFKIFGGINNEKDNFKIIRINPILPQFINEMTCVYKSIRGEIRVDLRKIGGKTYMDVIIPPNCDALVTTPNGETLMLQNGKYML